MRTAGFLKLKLWSVIGALLIAVAPGAAIAGTVIYDGSDSGYNYSWDVYGDNTAIGIHDGECDGDGGYAHYYTTTDLGTQRRINDPDGCSPQEGIATGLVYLYRHRTCEDHQFSPDPCSGWNYE